MKSITAALIVFMVSTTFLFNNAVSSSLEGVAPDFTLDNRNGENIRLSDHLGEVVMINFWASWCGPCRQEMPLLEDLHNKYQMMGFTLLGVNVDEERENAEKLLEQIPVSFPVLFDADSAVSRLYSVKAMPTTILIDRDGQLRVLHKGYQPGYEDQYEADIKALIRE